MQTNIAPTDSHSATLGKFERFFAACGGSTIATLEKSSADDQQKRITAGIVVVIVAAVSAVLASVAWSIPMGPAGYLVGIPWFLIMLFLERSILQQMDVVAYQKLAQQWLEGNFKARAGERSAVGFGWLITRFLMIFFICYFNSEMVRVVMFQPEIIAEIKIRQDAELQSIADSISVIRKDLVAEVSQYETAVEDAQQDLMLLMAEYDAQISAVNDSLTMLNAKLPHEVRGDRSSISGIAGDGPVARSIRESIASFQQQKASLISERNEARVSSAQARNLSFAEGELADAREAAVIVDAELDDIEKALVQKVIDRPVNGLSFMLDVLNDIASRNMIIWAVFFMFFFIEAIPVLLKFFSKTDSFIHYRALEHLDLMKESSTRARAVVEAIRAMEQNQSLASATP